MGEQRVALVTGASRGIGCAIATDLSRRGYLVVGCSRQGSDSVEGSPFPVERVDVVDEVAVRDLIGRILREHGRLDVVVNSAGVAHPAVLALRLPTKTFEEVLKTNVLGTFIVSREAARAMVARRFGRIVNLASTTVPLATEGTAAYSASKAAIIQFTRVFAKELAPVGVTCNVVAPSIVSTDMTKRLEQAAVVRHHLDNLAIKRPATTEDVTNAVWFFIQPESSYITGQVVYLGMGA